VYCHGETEKYVSAISFYLKLQFAYFIGDYFLKFNDLPAGLYSKIFVSLYSEINLNMSIANFKTIFDYMLEEPGKSILQPISILLGWLVFRRIKSSLKFNSWFSPYQQEFFLFFISLENYSFPFF